MKHKLFLNPCNH